MTTTSVTERVLFALEQGEELTAKQISTRYNVANPHNVVYTLRGEGFPIYLNTRRNSHGRVTKKYRLGTPSRALIAAGFQAIRSGLADASGF